MRALQTVIVLAAVLVGSALSAEWFDSYERGLSALERKDAGRAISEFEAAIRQRPEPGQNLLTYGTNRLGRYHPYLRLAEAQLLAGKPDQALVTLGVSE